MVGEVRSENDREHHDDKGGGGGDFRAFFEGWSVSFSEG